jgi:hypothetical protein
MNATPPIEAPVEQQPPATPLGLESEKLKAMFAGVSIGEKGLNE